MDNVANLIPTAYSGLKLPAVSSAACQTCNDHGYIYVSNLYEGQHVTMFCPDCEKGVEAKTAVDREVLRAEVEELNMKFKDRIPGSGILPRCKNFRFETFPGGVTGDVEVAQRFVKTLAHRYRHDTKDFDIPESTQYPRIGIYIVGPEGTGKTGLAIAMSQELTEGLVPNVIIPFDTFADIYEKNAGAMSVAVSAPVVFIDDFGCEDGIGWKKQKAIGALRKIIYARYDKKLPTVITTNLLIDQIPVIYGENGIRVADRIRDMVGVGSDDCRVLKLLVHLRAEEKPQTATQTVF